MSESNTHPNTIEQIVINFYQGESIADISKQTGLDVLLIESVIRFAMKAYANRK